MPTDVKIRRLVERLLRREFHPRYLTDIFLAIRFRSYGASSIKEIGHFVAHSDNRTHGLITDEAQDVFRFFRASMPYWWDKPLDWSNLPPNFDYFLARNFRRLTHEQIKTNTGFTQKRAAVLLKSALKNFRTRSDGRQVFLGCANQDEASILRYSYHTVVLRPLFTSDSLHRDFIFVLARNRLLASSERQALNYLRAPLSLYAIERMNQTTLILDDGWNVHLHCSLLSNDNTSRLLGVSSHVGFSPDLKGIAGLSSSVFSTDLIADDWCSDELLAALGHDFPNVEIELTATPQLVCI